MSLIMLPLRFKEKILVLDSGCWIWRGAKLAKRYGWFSYGGEPDGAHRWMYRFVFGPIPEGKQVCHCCDVPLCVNPKHLFLGTQRDNLQDMERKGRGNYSGLVLGQAPGELNPRAKLSSEEVRDLRRMRALGLSYEQLARNFGVSKSVAFRAAKGQSYSYYSNPTGY